MKKLVLRSLLLALLLPAHSLLARQTYTADLRNSEVPVLTGHLKLGANKSPSGGTLDANSLYFIKNGKPWFPVMGEIHFSRYPRSQWEESILKMKAAGIDVIASYVFWIYHEEEEGKFDWSGNRDLREFAALCKKHNVFLFVRIGPWCHGEVRNGGFPDWLVKRGNTRKNTPEYLGSVRKFYNEIGKQLNGLYFKDGGPVIGTQIENEFRFNSAAGLEHMLTLKKMAVEAGIDVPYYTATGWPGSNQQQDELVPVWGAYPEAPWDKKTTKLGLSVNYTFGAIRDPSIGSDILGKQDATLNFKGYRYPYATAEMGGGNEITYHRRPIIEANDVTALTYVKTGSGANLMGYYMFHGGSNAIGRSSTLQESKATNYANDYPIISYDFFAPIGEWGQLRPSYRQFKVVHTFLNEFGDRLVQQFPSFPDKKPSGLDDKETLRFSVRSKDNSGFVFVSNFQRQLEMKDQTGIRFDLTLQNGGHLVFPQTGMTIKSRLQAIFPFNMDLDGVNLQYATAQPLCRIGGVIPAYVFFAPDGILPEYALDGGGLASVNASKGDAVEKKGTGWLFNVRSPGFTNVTELVLKNGKRVRIITLSSQEALDSWKADVFGGEHLIISKNDLTFSNGMICAKSENSAALNIYPEVKGLKSDGKNPSGSSSGPLFNSYLFPGPSVQKTSIPFKEVSDPGKYAYTGPPVPPDDRNAKNLPTSPGAQYQTTLKDVPGAKYWEFTVPPLNQPGETDAFLSINYTGDTLSAYEDGKLIADDFYTGLPMTIALKRFGKEFAGKKIILQVIPLTDERQIYFEDGVREPLKGKTVAQLNAIGLKLQYEFWIGTK